MALEQQENHSGNFTDFRHCHHWSQPDIPAWENLGFWGNNRVPVLYQGAVPDILMILAIIIFLLLLLIALTLIMVGFFLIYEKPGMVYVYMILIIMAAILGLILTFPRYFDKHEGSGIVADLVFLLPGLLIFVW